MRSIVLASTSRYRRDLLNRLGLVYEAVAPRFEESIRIGIEPGDLVLEQAAGKAGSVAADFPESLIIGSDQLVALGDHVLGKPGTPDRAVAQLQSMRGREHELLTAAVVLDAASGQRRSHLEVSRIRVRDLTDAEIQAYVRRENPIDCAGAYRAEALGIILFDYLRGDDPTAIVGLPLIATCRLLREFGVNVLMDG
jgi:septum formation protein